MNSERNKILCIGLRAVCVFLITLTVSCRAGGIVQISKFPERKSALPRTITIVNWNAQKIQDPEFQGDLQTVIELHKPDIVFLQEAHKDLLQIEGIGGYFAKSWSYPWPGGTTFGVMTLSRIAPSRIQPVPTTYREFFVTAPKVSLITEHPLSNGAVLLAVNIHLLNFERWGVLKLRSQLDDLKSIIANHSGPIIIAGDFNTWNRKRLRLVQEFANNLHLKEVADFPPGRSTGDMHWSFLNRLFGIEKELPLDRIFYRGFSHHSAQVLSRDSSDHKPIQVTLTLQQESFLTILRFAEAKREGHGAKHEKQKNLLIRHSGTGQLIEPPAVIHPALL